MEQVCGHPRDPRHLVCPTPAVAVALLSCFDICQNQNISMSGFEANWKCASLTRCLQEIRQHFPPDQLVPCELSTPFGPVPHQAPRYLYRGECGLFPTTEASHVRVERSLGSREKEALRRVVAAMRWVFRQDGYDNSEWDAEGLIEHYGVPTVITNFSSSPDVAAAFATSGDFNSGRICILTRPYSCQEAAVVDYTRHPWAERALRQKAFGIRPAHFTDLKSREADRGLGAIWVEFPLTDLDRLIWRPRYDNLVDPSNDPHSAIVRGEVNHFVERFGKLPHKVAKHLAERIPMVPRFHKVSEVDEINREAITYRVAPSALAYSASRERERSIRYWSEDYNDANDSLTRFYPFKTPRDPGAILVWPGTYHGPNRDGQMFAGDAFQM
jgi:hypothetical protein